jgi:hypothetical protein
MKLLLENWREYLKEEFGSIIIDEFLTEDDRHIVIVKTLEGPVAFYRSTGGGSGSWTKGMYLPFDGVSPDGPGPASKFWFAKMDPSHPQSGKESSKVPEERSEFDRIGKYLSSEYGQSGSGQSASEFMDSIGYKSSEELGIKASPMLGNPLYDSMATNLFLQKWGALAALGNDYRWWGIDEIDGFKAEKK